MFFNEKEYRPYDEYYYVSIDGDVYSAYKKDTMKHYIDHNGYHRVDIHGRHIKVHKLVYSVWIGDVPDGKIIRHLDDDKDNNHADNLGLGTQKENIKDAFRNGHKFLKGNAHTLTVYDKLIDEEVTFCPAERFIEYSRHSCVNGGISRMMSRNWFKERFDVIKYKLGKV